MEQLIDVPRGTPQYRIFRTFSRRPDLITVSAIRRFSPRFLAIRRFGDFRPAFSLFGDSAVRVGRRSADPRVAPHNRPDPIVTCRRNAETSNRLNVFRYVFTFRRFDVSAGRRFLRVNRATGRRRIPTSEPQKKKLKWKITFIKFFNNRLDGSPPRRTACPFGWGLLRIDEPASRLYKYRYALFTDLQTKRRKIP